MGFKGVFIARTCIPDDIDFSSAVKIENFQLKNVDNFLIIFFFAPKHIDLIDCGYSLKRRGGLNEYPQFMFWSKIKQNRYAHAYPSLLYKSVV